MPNKSNSLPVARVLKYRNKILEKLNLHFVGLTLTEQLFFNFVEAIHLLLPDTIKFETLFHSCQHALGTQLTGTDAFDLAWRLSGNIPRLKEGKSVSIWTGQTENEWVPVQVIETKPTMDKKNRFCHFVTFRIMAGLACPAFVTKLWTNKFCKFVSKEIGFSAPWGKFPFTDGSELTSMRMLAFMTTENTKDYPWFEQTSASSATKTWNRTILKARMRIKPPCPANFEHPCHKCPIGYDKCMAGTHPATYVIKFCTHCETEQYFNPMSDSRRCVNCQRLRS